MRAAGYWRGRGIRFQNLYFLLFMLLMLLFAANLLGRFEFSLPGRWLTAPRRLLALGLVLTAVWMRRLLSNHLLSPLIGVMALGRCAG